MKPDRLITGGAFRVSRNPQNVGIGVAMAGVALLGDSWIAQRLIGGQPARAPLTAAAGLAV